MTGARQLGLIVIALLFFARSATAAEPWILHNDRVLDPSRASVAKIAAGFSNDPVAEAFAFVRDRIRFEPYNGVLRGAHGTLLARAGNSVDQALLLAALLTEKGIKTRLVQGTLDEAFATELLFDTVSVATDPDAGSASPEAEAVARDVRDGVQSSYTLLKTTLESGAVTPSAKQTVDHLTMMREHWWVEYRKGSEWISLDPSFLSALAGDSFAEPSARRSAVPKKLFHRVEIRVLVEEMKGHRLSTRTVLRFRATAADLSGQSLVLSHQPANWGGPLAAIAGPTSAENVDTAEYEGPLMPVLTTEDQVLQGNSFTLEASDKPARGGGIAIGGIGASAGKALTATAERIEIVFTSPNGGRETSTSIVFDRIGFAARAAGTKTGPTGLAEANPLGTVVSLSFFTGVTADPAVLEIINSPWSEVADRDPPTALNVSNYLADLSYSVALVADSLMAPATFEDGKVVFVATSPRLVIASMRSDGEGKRKTVSIDLRRSSFVPVTLSEELAKEMFRLRMLKGVVDAYIESAVLRALAPTEVVANLSGHGTAPVFAMAAEQGIAPVLLPPDSSASALSQRGYSPEAAARISKDLSDGALIIAPARPVTMEDGERIAWWRIDPATGKTVSVTEAGLHGDMVEYEVVASKLSNGTRIVHSVTIHAPDMQYRFYAFGKLVSPLGNFNILNFLRASGRTLTIIII